MKTNFLLLKLFLICICASVYGQDTTINNFDTVAPTVSAQYGSSFSIVANPNSNGNTTTSCGKIGRTWNNWYELISFPTSFSVPANTTQYLHILVNYAAQPDAGIRVDGNTIIRPSNVYTNFGGWQDLVFAINGGASGTTVTELMYHADLGFNNSPAGQILNNTDKFGYIDEIIFNSSATPRSLNIFNPILSNFETISPIVTTNYGSTFSVVDNPNTTGNTSTSCAKIGRTSANWYELVSFPTSFSVAANTTKYLHLMVNYPTQPDIAIRVDATSENPDGTTPIRPFNTYTNVGGWQDLVFVINGGTSGINVSSIVINTDLGFENASASQVLNNTDKFGYIDEILLNGSSVPRPIVADNPIKNNFETVSPTVRTEFGATFAVVANPNTTGNTSATCGKIGRTSANWYELVSFPSTFSVVENTTKYLHIMVNYPVQPDIAIRVDATSENPNGTTDIRPTNIYTNIGGWQDLVFAVNGGASGINVNSIVILADVGAENSSVAQVLNNADKFGYIDEIIFNDNSQPRDIVVENPIKNDFETISPVVSTNYGATFSVVANPNTTGNTSASCGKIGRTTTNFYELISFPTTFFVPANTTKYLHMLVNYATQPDIVIRVDATAGNPDGSNGIRPSNTYTNIGGWQDLVFAINGGASGINASSIVILTDVGYENASVSQVLNNSNLFGYIDDIIFNGISAPRVLFVENPIKNNFETVSPTVTTNYGSSFSIVANPNIIGNDTPFCGKIARTTTNWYELLSFPSTFFVPANTTKYLHLLVNYPAQPDISVRVDGSTDIRPTNTYTNIGGWQDLVFAVNGGASGINVSSIVIVPDAGFENISESQVLNNTDLFGYIDEIILDNNPSSRSQFWYQDIDGDTYGNALISQISVSQPAGYVTNNTDCNDRNATIYPSAIEIYDRLDNDCDGLVDEGAALPSTLTLCKGSATPAIARGTTDLQLYASASATAVALADNFVLTSKIYYATLNGSARTAVTVTVINLPSEVIGSITSNTAGTTAGTFRAATLAVGPFVGTSTTVSYRVPAFVGANSYFWTVPSGVRIVGQAEGVRTVTQTGANGNVLNVNYSGIAAGIGSVGAITVQAQNANGCNGAAKSVTLTKALPLAPAAITMHDLSLPLPTSGIPTAVRSFAKYMGTNAVLRLTATPSVAATSYEWNLPAGVNQLSGGTSNVITVNFAGVTRSNTDNFTTTAGVSTNVLRIGVKAVNGVGVSTVSNSALVNPTTTSTARLLTLTAVAPAAPTLRMLDMAVSSTVAVTDISRYIGTNTPLTLVGTVAATTLASSFSWELAEGVNVVAGSVLSSNSIRVNFEDVEPGTASLYIGIKAVNGMGSSVRSNATATPATSSTATLLKLSAGLPSAAGAVVGSLAICSNRASSVTYTITAAAGKANSYRITAPVGTTIVGGTGNTITINAVAGAAFTVNYPNGFTSVRPTQRSISIQSINGFGVSATNKVLTLTSNACTTSSRTAKVAPIAQEFKVIAYPNPSSGVFNLAIESSNASATTIQVYDMQGKMIENMQVNTNAVEIGANYTSGIYNVILENAGQAKTIRLIKK